MTLSRRELALAWMTGVVVLFGLTFVVCSPRFKEWRTLVRDQAELAGKIARTQTLLDQRAKWEKRLADQRKHLVQYPAEKDVTADVLIKIESVAKKGSLTLLSREVEKEAPHGTFYEQAVNCKWEGNLQSIVSFLFELQQEGAMLDASQISIAPNEKRVLRGSFTVNSAYCRLEPPSGTNDVRVKTGGTR